MVGSEEHLESGESLLSDAGGRTGPVVISVGVLSLTPTNCNTQESKACISPGQRNRANMVRTGIGEPALKL